MPNLSLTRRSPLGALPGLAGLVGLVAVAAGLGGGVASAEPTVEMRVRTAKAYGLEDGRLIYGERHLERWVGGRHAGSEVEYRAADGRLLARKTLTYGSRVTLPAFSFTDVRTGLEEGARWDGKTLELLRREARGAELEARAVEVPDPAALDAGFDKAVGVHWDLLAAGETVTFVFGVPAKLDTFRLRLTKTGLVARGARTLLELRMEPDSRLLRWLVDPVVIRYDCATRSLVEYEGRSNILDDAGATQDVLIVFDPEVPTYVDGLLLERTSR